MSEINNDSKLFMVEFGDPTIENYSSLSDIKPLFVIASSFDKAGVKAFNYAVKQQEEKEKLVLDKKNDNSLVKIIEVKVRAVRLISMEII